MPPTRGPTSSRGPFWKSWNDISTSLEKQKDLKGLIIDSAKPGIFISGADIREFLAAKTISREQKVELSTRGRKLFQRLSHFPFVTVAAIDGVCLGGGAELAMWCDRRLMSTSPKAQFGFPEVKLGMFPGWGGTARTPRIVGLANAVEMVTERRDRRRQDGRHDGPGHRRGAERQAAAKRPSN